MLITISRYQTEDEPMLSLSRTIERVPPALPSLLWDLGKLSAPPQPPQNVHGYRPATLDDAEALTWLILWRGQPDGSGLRKVGACTAYYDHFDWHTSSDVRELVFLSGDARSMRDIVKYVRRDLSDRQRLIALVDMDKAKLLHGIEQLGATHTRNVMEFV